VITEGNRLEMSRQLWASVCGVRGTSAPDPVHVREFLRTLEADVRRALDQTLTACMNGKEQNLDMEVLSWAAACTRPSYVAKVRDLGVECCGATLFSAGLSLMATGWAMSQRIAHLSETPADVERLRAVLALQLAPSVTKAVKAMPEDDKFSRPSSNDKPWPARQLQSKPMRSAAEPVPQLQEKPKFLAIPLENPTPSSASPPSVSHLQLKLFGRDAAHTLEVGPHRRSADFLNVHVVTIESARALQGGGYDWRQKLTIQLTPDEMPAVIAVLIGVNMSVKFSQHGADHDKFVEFRRQEGGILLVTGQQKNAYAVPVKFALLYYLLDLFCRALAWRENTRTVSDVLALVKASTSG
jgi:hypothetical protein